MWEIRVPHLGESIYEAHLVKWLKKPGDIVDTHSAIAELETEKVTLEVFSPKDGILSTQNVLEGEKVLVGNLIGYVEENKAVRVVGSQELKETSFISDASEKESENHTLDTQDRLVKRIPMSSLRQTVARRLKEAQNQAAILTTFNEVDMGCVVDIRERFQKKFEEKHGVKLGFMSFFVKAVIHALKEIPALNAHIENDEIVSKNYYDINVAISGPLGLVTPALFNADDMDFADIEKRILELSQKVKNRTLTMDDLRGGTFTITNGGVFGSLLSTPLLNPLQSGILGLHKIEDRPIAYKGNIIIRPMMYIALSYDHRLIDGKEAVTFLKYIKDYIEYPDRIVI